MNKSVGLVVLMLLGAMNSWAQDKLFNGLSLGAEIGNQYMFGGAQVDGVETIGDGNRWVYGGALLYRKQWNSGIVSGVAFEWNKPQGTFINNSNPDGTLVDYEIRPQTAVQFTLGKALGASRNQLLTAYFAFNQTRFDILITRPIGNFHQTDFENFGRIGLGYERQLLPHLSARMIVGSSMDALEGTDNGIDAKMSFFYCIKKPAPQV